MSELHLKYEQHVPNDTAPEKSEEPAYLILSTPELRAEYITLTDGLIRKLTDANTDVAIFLDKSARPVAWLTSELWDILAPRDKNGIVARKPDFKFLNIDREQWGAIIGRSEDEDAGGMDVKRLPANRLNELRELYSPIMGKSAPSDVSLLTDKNVMIIDEVGVSGDTLSMSKDILTHAFPDVAKIDSAYWMIGKVQTEPRTGIRKNTALPVWYSDERSTGRGVADRDTTKSSISPSSRQRVGKYWLSTPFRGGKDVDGTQLRKEVKQLAQDVAEHRMLYRPASGWGEELDARMKRINGIKTDTYASLLEAAGSDVGQQIILYTEHMLRQDPQKVHKDVGKVATQA